MQPLGLKAGSTLEMGKEPSWAVLDLVTFVVAEEFKSYSIMKSSDGASTKPEVD